MSNEKGRIKERTGRGRYLFDRPFPLEELEIAVDHVEGDLPPARPSVGQHLHVPLVAVNGALGVELESQREVLLPDLAFPHGAHEKFPIHSCMNKQDAFTG